MSDSVQPQRRQPTRLPSPWDSPGKNTRVGCHFLLQCMKVKSESEVVQSCPTLCDPMDYIVHGILQARILEWVAFPLNYHTIALISHASKVMLKILQAKLQQYMSRELPDVQAGFRKGRGTRDQIANICWIIEKAREFWKNIYFCFIDYVKAFDCVDHNQLWKILKEMGIQDHLTCLLRNLYAGQEATVRTRHGTTYWFQIGKGINQGCILVPCLFNLYAEYIMRNARLEETQA